MKDCQNKNIKSTNTTKSVARIRPPKASSIACGIVGIFFCIIGFTIVIQVGPFGWLWTGIAVFITVSSFYNAFSKKGMATSEIIVDEDNLPHGTITHQNTILASVEDRLNEVKGLYEKGLITYAEYEEKRKEIIDEI